MRKNHNTATRPTVRHFVLGQTYITPGAEEALQIAGQTEMEFLRLHMSCQWGELSEEDVRENELALNKGFRLLSAYRTGKGQKLDHHRSGSQRHHDPFAFGILKEKTRAARVLVPPAPLTP